MFNAEEFIKNVRDQPAIWEKNSRDYSNKVCREKSWNAVGENFYQNWQEFDLEMRSEKVKEMKKKWRHLRDNFLKYMNQKKTGHVASRKRRTYVYAIALSFLLCTMEERDTTVNNTNDVDEVEEDIETEESTEDEDYKDPLKLTIPVVPSKRQCRIPQENSINLSHSQNELPITSHSSPKEEKEDADKYFLLSLLPDYKKLNDAEKIDFRLVVLKFFRDVHRKNKF